MECFEFLGEKERGKKIHSQKMEFDGLGVFICLDEVGFVASSRLVRMVFLNFVRPNLA